jgi:hypothetical protein
VDFAGDFNAIRLVVEPAECRLAVIGGVALAAYGHPRMTLDLDVSSRLELSPAEVDALLPDDALDRRAPFRPGARPFELP